MATVALRRPGAVGARTVAGIHISVLAGLGALLALSLVLRTSHFGVHFWIDEGLSVGIADRPLSEIPGVLRLDGSPPLYYVLLSGWIALFGQSVETTHALSLVFALLVIPVSFWAGASLFDRGVGWTLAVLAALNPFLSAYAQETRMYSLVVLLTTVCIACFLHAYVFGRRRYRIGFGVALAALLYTHNWTYFLGAALVVALALIWRETPQPERRALLRDIAVGFGTAGLLFLPWIPSFVFQALHTGAPWAVAPTTKTLVHSPDLLLGGQAGTIVLLLAGGTGLATLWSGAARERRIVLPVLVALAIAPILIAWLTSQASPAWATRYLAIAVAPMLLLLAVGLRRAGNLGIVALVLLALLWVGSTGPRSKSNAHYVAVTMEPHLRAGDTVISTQPEQVPVLSYYLPAGLGLRWATPFGSQEDTGVTDWRDGAEHFDRTGVTTQLLPILKAVPQGRRVLLVKPIIVRPERWRAPWTRRVHERTIEYEGIMRGDGRFRLLATVPEHFRTTGPNPLQGLLFEKVRPG